MDASQRLRLFRELCELSGRVQAKGVAVGPFLESLRELAQAIARGDADDFNDWLLWSAPLGPTRPSKTAGPPCPAPAALGLLCARGAELYAGAAATRESLIVAALLEPLSAEQLGEARLADPSGLALDAVVLRLVQCRAERLDGSGPLGLRAEQIDGTSRFLAAARAYGERVRAAKPPHRVLAELHADRDRFDNAAVAALVQALSAFPIGSLVRLHDDTEGMVVGSHAAAPLRPLVALVAGPDGQRFDPPARRALAGGPEDAVRALLDDPGAPMPQLGETAGDWLDRLARSPMPSGAPPGPGSGPPRPGSGPPRPGSGPTIERAELLSRLSLGLDAAPGAGLRGLEEKIRGRTRELDRATRERRDRRAAEEARRRLDFERAAASADREMADLLAAHREAVRELEERRAALGSAAAAASLGTLTALWRERLKVLEGLREAWLAGEVQQRRLELEWQVERARLEREHAADVGAYRARRGRQAERLRRQVAGVRDASSMAEAALASLRGAPAAAPEGAQLEEAAQDALTGKEANETLRAMEALIDGTGRDLDALRSSIGLAQERAAAIDRERSEMRSKLLGEAKSERRRLRDAEPVAPLRSALKSARSRCAELSRQLVLAHQALVERLAARWADQRPRLARGHAASLTASRERRRRLARRAQAELDRLGTARAEGQEALEALTIELERGLPGVHLSAAALGKLEAQRLDYALDLPDFHEAAAQLARQGKALDEELGLAQSAWDALAARARVRDERERRFREGLKARFNAARRGLREELPLAALRAELRELRQRLARLQEEKRLAGSRLEEARRRKQGGADRLDRLRRATQRCRERWAARRGALEAELAAKREELRRLRERTLKDREALERREAELESGARLFGDELVTRLKDHHSSRQALLRRLVENAARLRAALDEAGRSWASAAAALERERQALEREAQGLQGECGDLQGRLAAHAAETGPLRHSLQASLSEFEAKLVEARLAADRAQSDLRDLERARGPEFALLEQASSRLDATLAECASASQVEARLWEKWARATRQNLAPVAESLRQELLSRARDLRGWQGRMSEVAERLATLRDALHGQVASALVASAERALQAGELERARDALRRALALRSDPETEKTLKAVEARLADG